MVRMSEPTVVYRCPFHGVVPYTQLDVEYVPPGTADELRCPILVNVESQKDPVPCDATLERVESNA
jgi:hypothetical protein